MDPVRRSVRAAKARLVHELSLVDIADITEDDLRLMKCLMEDSDIRTILNETFDKDENGTINEH